MTTQTSAEEKLRKLVGDQPVSEQAKAFIANLITSTLAVVTPDVFVWLTSRSEWGGSGGIGYFDQVRIYYHGQTKLAEYQWRDRYSASNDKPWLKVNSFGATSVEVSGNKATVSVELVNIDGKRTEKYVFEHKEVVAPTQLSSDEQTLFTTRVEQAVGEIMTEKNHLYELKPTMVGHTGNYVPYRRPSVKQSVVHANLGISAFVIEEQIDHRVDDPQTRYELYVMFAKDKTYRYITEDHGYEKREGSNVIAILELTQDSVLVNTKNGQKTLKIQPS